MKINNERFEVALASSCMALKELSEKSGVRQETIARIKKSLQNPNPSTVGKIAKALGVTVQELIETEAATSNQFNRDSGNKIRRKSLEEVIAKIQELSEEIESFMADEEEYRDNMPENLQGSERYEKADEACSAMQDAIDNLEEAVENLEIATE